VARNLKDGTQYVVQLIMGGEQDDESEPLTDCLVGRLEVKIATS
jgi:hypothetical protein